MAQSTYYARGSRAAHRDRQRRCYVSIILACTGMGLLYEYAASSASVGFRPVIRATF